MRAEDVNHGREHGLHAPPSRAADASLRLIHGQSPRIAGGGRGVTGDNERNILAAALIAGLLCIVASMPSRAQQTAPRDPDSGPAVGRIFESTAAPATEAAAAPTIAADSRDPAVMDRGLLVDRRGMTLYTFDGDRRPRVSTCYGICETLWPPLYAGLDDVSHGAFAIVHRRDGSLQWAYQGKPLYYWKRDTKPGDITGDKVNNVWHIVRDTAPGTP